MNKNITFHSLGAPALTDELGQAIHVKTRKALALLTVLFRRNGQPAAREEIADLFWSAADRDRASQSLRQALRQVRLIEKACGIPFLEAKQTYLAAHAGPLNWDVQTIFQLLQHGNGSSLETARDLWKGPFLEGYDTLDPNFGDWLAVERENIRWQAVERLVELFSSAERSGNSTTLEGAARFVVDIDPGHEIAHETLIRYYRETGQMELAQQQMNACERELNHKPGLAANARRAIETSRQTKPLATGQSSALTGRPQGLAFLPEGDEVIRLPKIAIASIAVQKKGDAKARALRDEIVNGLSSYQYFDLYQADYEEPGGVSALARLDDGELGSYLLRFRTECELEKVYLQFEDRQSGKILFHDVVDLSEWSTSCEARPLAFHSVNRIHSQVLHRLRNPRNTAPFAKWCQAEAMLWEFSRAADEKALRILNDLELQCPQFSLTYAGKASIEMKQLLYYAVKNASDVPRIEEAVMLAEKAVTLDPWQSINQRLFGWALVLSGATEDAGNAFSEASRLNPMDPSNLMSVAEGLAALGRYQEAVKYAEKALSTFTFPPRIVNEYMANIYFAAGDYERAIQFGERAPLGSLISLATRVSALMCVGRESEARSVLQLYKGKYENLLSSDLFAEINDASWDQRINIFQDPRVRHNYQVGASLVRRSVLGEA